MRKTQKKQEGSEEEEQRGGGGEEYLIQQNNNSNNCNNGGIITQKVSASVQQCSVESWQSAPISVEWDLIVLDVLASVSANRVK